MSVDDTQLLRLADDFGEVPERVMDALLDEAQAAAKDGKQAWRQHAKRTSGRHGKRYPSSLRTRTDSGVDWVASEVWSVNPAVRGYEFGSRNQPPHLDATKAYPATAERFAKACTDAVERAAQL